MNAYTSAGGVIKEIDNARDRSNNSEFFNQAKGKFRSFEFEKNRLSGIKTMINSHNHSPFVPSPAPRQARDENHEFSDANEQDRKSTDDLVL